MDEKDGASQTPDSVAENLVPAAGSQTTGQLKVHHEVDKRLGERLGGSSEEVKNAVVDHLYQEELQKRKGAVLGARKKLKELEIELRKIKGTILYDGEGKGLTPTFTADESKKRKDTQDAIEKLSKKLESAIGKNTNGDWSELYNLVGGGKE